MYVPIYLSCLVPSASPRNWRILTHAHGYTPALCLILCACCIVVIHCCTAARGSTWLSDNCNLNASWAPTQCNPTSASPVFAPCTYKYQTSPHAARE